MLKEWLDENGMEITIANIKVYQQITKAKMYAINLVNSGFYLSENPLNLQENGNKEFIVVEAISTEMRAFTTVTINPKYIVSVNEF